MSTDAELGMGGGQGHGSRSDAVGVVPGGPRSAVRRPDAADGSPVRQSRSLAGGVLISGSSRVLVAVTGATATIIVARLLGRSGTGAFAIAQTLVLALTLFATLGVDHGIAYYVSSGRWDAKRAHRSAQRVAFVSGSVAAGIGLLIRAAAPSAFDGLSWGVTIVAAAALPFSLSWCYTSYIAVAIDRYEAFALAPAMQSLLVMCLVAALAVPFGLAGAVAGFATAYVITAAAMRVWARRTFSGWSGDEKDVHAPEGEADEPGQLRRAIRFGVKGYASNALQLINFRIDLFILNAVATTAVVGDYAVAVSVTSVMWLLPRALGDVLFPRIASLSSDTHGAHSRSLVEAKSLRHTVIATLVSTVVIALALLLLVVPVYGPQFLPAISLGLILLPGVALLGLSAPLGAMIVGRGHPGMALVGAIVVTPLAIALYVLLIPAMHATGAALASSISYTASFAMTAAFYKRATGARLIAHLLPTRSELADYRALAPAIVAGIRERVGRR